MMDKLKDCRPNLNLPSSFTASVMSHEGIAGNFIPVLNTEDNEIAVEEVKNPEIYIDEVKQALLN